MFSESEVSVGSLPTRNRTRYPLIEVAHKDMQPLYGSLGTRFWRWYFDPAGLAEVLEHDWNPLGRRAWIEPGTVTLMSPPAAHEASSREADDIVKALAARRKVTVFSARGDTSAWVEPRCRA